MLQCCSVALDAVLSITNMMLLLSLLLLSRLLGSVVLIPLTVCGIASLSDSIAYIAVTVTAVWDSIACHPVLYDVSVLCAVSVPVLYLCVYLYTFK